MKKWKRTLSVALAVTMAVGLCACGGKGNTGEGGRGGNIRKKQDAVASNEEAKQFVYKMNEIDMGALQGTYEDCSVQNIQKLNNKIYMMMQGYDYSDESGSSSRYVLASMNTDGTGLTTCELELPEQSAQSGDETVTDGEAKMEESSAYDYTYYNSMQLVEGGHVYGVRIHEHSDWSDPDNYVNERSETMCCWDVDGKLLWESPLELGGDDDSWYYINTMIGQKDGSVILIVSGDTPGTLKVDADGNAGQLETGGELSDIMQNYSGVAVLPDGKMLITYYQSDDWSSMYLGTYDFAAKKMGEAVKLPGTVANNMNGRFMADADGNLLYTTNAGVFRYRVGAENGEQIMSFVNSDLYVTNFDAFLPLEEDQFVGVYSEYDEEYYHRTLYGGIFTKVDPKDIVDKKVLTLAGNWLYGDLQKRVVDFNKSSDEYRIVMKDYSQYNTYDDYNAGYTQLNNDIISGNMPDILVVDPYGMSIENYASKGLLADVGEMIAKDGELSKVDFMDNIFEALQINGKLYEVVPSFSVTTYVAKKSLVGDRTSWTMDEAMALMKDMPEGTQLFGDMVRDGYINNLMSMCGSQFVDVSTGKCNFNSDEFVALMEYAGTLPESMPDDYYDDNYYMSYQSQYREDRTILMYCGIYEFTDLVYSINGNFGEDVSYIGFPSAQKGSSGSVINANTTYTISASSPNQDAAWQFLRYYLTDEYQSSLAWQLPVNRKYLEEMAQKATKKPTYEDEDGKVVEDEYYTWINDEQVVIDPLSQEQVKEVLDFISGLDRKAYNDNNVTNIVTEEMGAFYKNQKSARDVASVIQSRVQIYVNENR